MQEFKQKEIKLTHILNAPKSKLRNKTQIWRKIWRTLCLSWCGGEKIRKQQHTSINSQEKTTLPCPKKSAFFLLKIHCCQENNTPPYSVKNDSQRENTKGVFIYLLEKINFPLQKAMFSLCTQFSVESKYEKINTQMQ